MRRASVARLFLSISVLALTACGGQPQGIEATKTAAPTPPPSITGSDLQPSDTLTPVSVTQNLEAPPASMQVSPAAAPASIPDMDAAPAPVTAQAAPATAQADPALEARIARMEAAVGSLRRDYDKIMPAFASLNTTNERIQTLLDEIEKEQGKLSSPQKAAVPVAPPAAEPVQPARAMAPPATISPVTLRPGEVSQRPQETVYPAEDYPGTLPQLEKLPHENAAPVMPSKEASAALQSAQADTAPQDFANVAKNIRFGEHGNKTRLVIDLATPDKPDVVYDLDNNEKLMLIELPATGWAGIREGGLKNSPYIAGWTAQPGAKGTSVAIQLKKEAKIVSTQYIKREGNTPARLVVDLGPAS